MTADTPRHPRSEILFVIFRSTMINLSRKLPLDEHGLAVLEVQGQALISEDDLG